MQGGVLVPADVFARKQLERKKLKEGSVVKLYVSKLRNPKFNRLVHNIGTLVVKNIEDFFGLDAHGAIKRLQYEGNIYCDELPVKIFGFDVKVWTYVRTVVEPILNMVGFRITDDGYMVVRMPRSLSFDSMDEAEFHDAARQICRLIAERYWANMEPEQIEQMAGCMVDE